MDNGDDLSKKVEEIMEKLRVCETNLRAERMADGHGKEELLSALIADILQDGGDFEDDNGPERAYDYARQVVGDLHGIRRKAGASIPVYRYCRPLE